MKTGLLRPSAALFPLAGLTAALLGREESVISLFFLVHCIQLFSLCAADCFRNGAAREPGVRRVDRRFGGALVQLAGGILLLALAARFLFPREIRACSLIAAACICIEQLFEERMFALSRSLDGAILSLISNLLLLVGLMLEGGALEGENRLVHNQTAWSGFCASPLLGSLLGGAKRLSQHSEALDLLSGLGVLGTAVFLAMQALMLRGGLRGLRQSSCRAQVWAAGCVFLAVAALGTVFYSRDIFLVLAGGLAGILSSKEH